MRLKIMLSKKEKFIIAGILCVSFSYTSLNAGILEDMGRQNTTAAQSWEDARTGTNYYSGGSITYRFKKNSNYSPNLTLKEPSGGVSCSGFSFDLGFAGIMDLKNIGEQLNDATKAAMWGLLTTFKLSTPNLSKVFEYINKMVRQIQDMLRNACSLSSKLAHSFTGKEGINLAGFADSSLNSIGDAAEKASLQQKGFTEQISEMIDKTASKSDIGKLDVLAPVFRATLDNYIKSDAAINSFSTYVSSVSEDIRNEFGSSNDVAFFCGTQKFSDIISSDKIIYDSKNNKTVTLVNDDYTKDSLKMSTIMSLSFFKDTLLEKQSAQDIASFCNTYSGISVSELITTKKDELKEFMKKLKERESTPKVIQTSTNKSSEEIVDFILKGGELESHDFSIEVVSFPRLKDPNNTAKDKRTFAAFPIVLQELPPSVNTKVSYVGAIKDSISGILYVINYGLPSNMQLKYDDTKEELISLVNSISPNSSTVATKPTSGLPYLAGDISSYVEEIHFNALKKQFVTKEALAAVKLIVLKNVFEVADKVANLVVDSRNVTKQSLSAPENYKENAEAFRKKSDIGKELDKRRDKVKIDENELSKIMNVIHFQNYEFNRNLNPTDRF